MEAQAAEPCLVGKKNQTGMVIAPRNVREAFDPDYDEMFLPLKDVVIRVDIKGTLALIRIRQEYSNPTGAVIEATYRFPNDSSVCI